MYDVSTANPDATFRIVTTLVGENSGVVLVELLAQDPVPVVTAIQKREEVVDFDILWKRDDETLLQIEAKDPSLLGPVWKAGVPLRLPFEIRDGETTWETTTSDDRLSEFGEMLADLGIEYDIQYVRDIRESPANHLLTDRQLELLVAAAEMGHYATPRTATLTEVAEAMDISKATASDILQRAEGKIIDWFIDKYVAADG